MNRLWAALLMTVPMAAFAVVPVNGATPPGTPVTISAGPRDQLDPHVNEDLAAYSSDRTIRYDRFSTAVTPEQGAPEAMGCSAAGSESAIAALIAIAMAWLLRARRKPVPVRERR